MLIPQVQSPVFINLSVEKKYFYKISIFYGSYSNLFDANSTGPVLSEGNKYLDKISIFYCFNSFWR